MDIARIRKKLKKLRMSGEQKADEIAKEDQPEKAVPAVIAARKDKKKTLEGSSESGAGLSQDAEAEEASSKTLEIIAFKIANEEYAVRITELQEVLRYQETTIIPRSPKFLKGVTSIRGKIIPIIDLNDRLGLDEEEGEKKKIIVLAGKKEPVGALISTISGVYRFKENELLPPPNTLSAEEKNFIEGVVKIKDKFISILKVDEIVTMEAP